MFNTTIHKHESKVVAITKEIEKTISPDKVTEMYDAVQEEVESRIIRSVAINSGVISAATLELQKRYDTMINEFVIRFLLNGKEYIHRGEFSLHEMQNVERMLEKTREFYQKAVAKVLIQSTGDTVLRSIDWKKP